jgi:hypothetical protein
LQSFSSLSANCGGPARGSRLGRLEILLVGGCGRRGLIRSGR